MMRCCLQTVVLPKSVTPSRVEENFNGKTHLPYLCLRSIYLTTHLVTKLPQDLFEKLEKAATSHKPERGLDPSKSWGVDIFE